MFTYDVISDHDIENIDNICVICWGLIGDVFIRVSLLESLKNRFPESSLTVIVDPASAVALRGHPDIDEVIKFSRKKSPVLAYLKNTFINMFMLRKKKFDLSLDLYGGGSSIFLTRIINARLRISFSHKASLRRVNNYRVKVPSFCENWTSELSKLLLPLGIDKVRQGTSYYCSNASFDFADKWLATIPDKKIVINLGAGAENKIWDISNFVDLAEIISINNSFHPIVLTNPGQTNLVNEFENLATGRFDFSILPETSFANVAAVISRTGLIITGDTSIMHLAFGLKCPTLGIFTRTRPEIVDPEDSLHIACFMEGNVYNNCGKLYGTKELSPETCYARFKTLLSKLE